MGEITFKYKFNIGEVVAIKDTDTHLVINNVWSETCKGGTQILYQGLVTTSLWGGKRTADLVGCKINEEMLETIKEEK